VVFFDIILNLIILLGPLLVWRRLRMVSRGGRGTQRRQSLRALPSRGSAAVHQMDGASFERYLEALFRNQGYQVERTPYQGDYGADLILCRDGTRTVVQAKRSAGNVGVKAVQEAVAARGYYGAHRAMVVTNSSFTRRAQELARANGVTLWGGEQIATLRPALARALYQG
jgi:restriction system protein